MRQVFIFAFIRGIPSAANIMYLVFLAPHQSFACDTPAGWIATEDECSMKPIELINDTAAAEMLPCTQWTYDHSVYAGITMVEEVN